MPECTHDRIIYIRTDGLDTLSCHLMLEQLGIMLHHLISVIMQADVHPIQVGYRCFCGTSFDIIGIDN